jgi:hypothetical protein
VERKQPATQVPTTGLRAVFVAEYAERARRFPGDQEYEFARRPLAGRATSLGIRRGHRGGGLGAAGRAPAERCADDYDRYRVGPAGELELVSRAVAEHAALLEQLTSD